MTDFEKLYYDYFNDVYRYILRLSGSEQVAEDITSETFFKAMQSVDRFRGDCDIRVWLCQIAKNCYYTYIKKHSKQKSLDDDVFMFLSDSVEDQVSRQDESQRIKEILHHIPEPYKEVVMWRIFADMSFRQIGQIFGKTENWACVTYHRARKIIKDRLEEDHNEK